MKKEIAVKKEEITALMEMPDNIDTGEILSSDVIIPRLLLMQGLSELVSERKAQQGDMVKSLGAVKVGDPEVAIEFIPLRIENTWVLSEEIGGKYEYRGSEPRTAKNEGLPWDFEQNGAKWKRTKNLNVYALLLKDMTQAGGKSDSDVPDLESVVLPLMISFRSTSFVAGKAVITHFAKAKAMNAAPYWYSLTLKSLATKNDKGNFYVFDIDGKAKAITKQAREVAQEWVLRLAQSTIKVDDSAGEMEVQSTTGKEIC